MKNIMYTEKTGLTFRSPVENKDTDRLYIEGLKTKNGVIKIEELVTTSKTKVYMTVTETKAPSGYEMLPAKVHLILTYNDKNGTWNLNKRNKTTDPNTNNNNLYFNEEKLKGYVSIDSKELKLTLKDDEETKIEELNILKTDTANTKISGAKFNINISNVKKIGSTNYDSGNANFTNQVINNGQLQLKGLVFKDANAPITITITETYAPTGYKKINGTMTVTITKNKNGFTIVKSKDNTVLDSEFKSGTETISGNSIAIGIKNNPKIEKLTILKTDLLDSSGVQGAKFNITLTNIKSLARYSTTSSGTVTITATTNNGNIELEDVVINDITKPVTITMVETEAPAGYKKIEGKITVKFIRSGDTYKITEQSKDSTVLDSEFKAGNAKVEKGSISIGINDIPVLKELDLFKIDSKNGDNLKGAEFKLEFTNIESYYKDGKKQTNGSITTSVDPEKALIENIRIKDMSKEARITLEETKAPRGYKKLVGKIYLNIRYTDQGYTITANKDKGILDQEFNTSSDAEIKDNKNVNVTIKDIPIISIGGIVWEDTQTGNKQISGPDGKLNEGEEKGISGIGVEIYNANGERIEKDIYGKKFENTTAVNGQKISYTLNNGGSDTIELKEGEYIFPNLEKGEYYVKFLYDGINYETAKISDNIYGLTSPKESKATEEGRGTFNARFETISQGKSNDGTPLGYDYNDTEKTSKLQVGIKGENPVSGNTDFQMKAKSSNYLKENDSNWKDVWTEEGKINRDHYAQDVNCGLVKKYFDLALGTDVKSARVTINGKEATYDYAEIMDGSLKDLDLNKITQNNSSDKDGVEYTLYLYYSDYNFRIEDYKTDMTEGIKDTTSGNDHSVVGNPDNKDIEKELKVYVTYSIILKNQSKQSGTVEKFEYYYDDKYISPTIAEMDDYDYAIDEANKKITFTHKGNSTLNEGNDYRKEIEVTFRVNKDSKGYILKGDFSNAGEIIEYSTPNGGFIDNDSAPENAGITKETDGQKKITHYEDDCDQAKGLNISPKEDKIRTIAGTVFEDANKNGSNDDSKPVNDVIVQLIELKLIKGNHYEYIWQQTRSGSNIVKTTSRNGYTGTEYTSDASGDGTYQFKEFIPGNYIIRFIYGDGSTYDITPNVQQYNGQDYKSTIDNSYKEEWYNQANYNGKSVARDNEARRLEVMAYSTTIDNDKGDKINKKEKEMLDKTWMCAETSKVNVAVEGDSTSYANMNFGLALRPQTKLTLEKHITGLKITPQGTGVQPIVDAKIVNGDIQGITTGLARIYSTRGNRGFWKVETDIEELAQGATVELEYTYTIKNESEEDYLSDTLINEYKNLNSEEYAKHLSDIVDKNQGNLKNKLKGKTNTYGTYLGEYYYTGTKGSTDSEVLSTVNVIEDNLNNNLKLIEETDMKFEKANNEAEEKTVYDDAGNKKPEKIETVIRNKEATEALAKDGVDSTRTVKLTTTLSSSNKEISYPAYIGEIVEYTNAAGRKDMEATPGNLSYVHSEATDITLDTVNPETNKKYNEHDEFWGETLMVSKPTGENKQAPMQIVIIAISSIAVIGVGIILIKKFVLK